MVKTARLAMAAILIAASLSIANAGNDQKASRAFSGQSLLVEKNRGGAAFHHRPRHRKPPAVSLDTESVRGADTTLYILTFHYAARGKNKSISLLLAEDGEWKPAFPPQAWPGKKAAPRNPSGVFHDVQPQGVYTYRVVAKDFSGREGISTLRVSLPGGNEAKEAAAAIPAPKEDGPDGNNSQRMKSLLPYFTPASIAMQATCITSPGYASELHRASVTFDKPIGKRISGYSLFFNFASEPHFTCAMGGAGIRLPIFTVNGITVYGDAGAAAGAKNGKLAITVPLHVPFECFAVGNGALALNLFCEASSTYSHPDARYMSGTMPAAPGIAGLDIAYWPSNRLFVSTALGGTSIELKEASTAACLVTLSAGYFGEYFSTTVGFSSSVPFPLGPSDNSELNISWWKALGGTFSIRYSIGGHIKKPQIAHPERCY
ncbi:MAG: hypothetical protein WC717_00100 [Candidatus Micrarchaeia archaeon]|jgi:hypothetical protein